MVGIFGETDAVAGAREDALYATFALVAVLSTATGSNRISRGFEKIRKTVTDFEPDRRDLLFANVVQFLNHILWIVTFFLVFSLDGYTGDTSLWYTWISLTGVILLSSVGSSWFFFANVPPRSGLAIGISVVQVISALAAAVIHVVLLYRNYALVSTTNAELASAWIAVFFQFFLWITSMFMSGWYISFYYGQPFMQSAMNLKRRYSPLGNGHRKGY